MKRFQEVAPGILRGGMPSEKEIRILKDIWGVKRIISLDLEAGEKINSICDKLGIEHIVLPIEFDEVYDNTKSVIKFLVDNIVSLLTDKQPVYIHCVHGRDRTGLAIALYRIKKEDWSTTKALNEAIVLDFGDGLSQKHLNLFLSIINQAGVKNTNKDDDIKKRKRKMRKIYLQDINDAMAYVGQNNSANPILRYVNYSGENYYNSIWPMGISPYGNYYL